LSRRRSPELGADGITTNCGFLSLYQRELAAAVAVPVATSSLMRVPLIQSSLPAGKRAGIITVSAASLTREHLIAIGLDSALPVVGTEGRREFTRVLIGNELTRLEEFAMHPRCTPERVGKAHRADQAAYSQRHRRPAPASSRFPTPIGSKPRSVPTDHGGWLDDRQCVASGRQPPKQADEYQPIDAAEAWSFGAVRRRTLICWRSAKFSATRAALNRKSPMNAHQINLQRSHIGRQHRHVACTLRAR
jgi:hypothetical protein